MAVTTYPQNIDVLRHRVLNALSSTQNIDALKSCLVILLKDSKANSSVIDENSGEYLNKALDVNPKKMNSSKPSYRISPRIKALEMGFSFPEDISDDYKQELNAIRAKRYL